MGSRLRCSRCGGGPDGMRLLALGVIEYEPLEGRWRATGETARAWLQCECGHIIRPRRNIAQLESFMAGVVRA